MDSTEDGVPASTDHDEDLNEQQSKQLLANSASRLWEELYVCKRPALEEVFKTSFPNQNSTPPLESIRSLIAEPAAKTWHTYVGLEKKAQYSRYRTESIFIINYDVLKYSPY